MVDGGAALRCRRRDNGRRVATAMGHRLGQRRQPDAVRTALVSALSLLHRNPILYRCAPCADPPGPVAAHGGTRPARRVTLDLGGRTAMGTDSGTRHDSFLRAGSFDARRSPAPDLAATASKRAYPHRIGRLPPGLVGQPHGSRPPDPFRQFRPLPARRHRRHHPDAGRSPQLGALARRSQPPDVHRALHAAPAGHPPDSLQHHKRHHRIPAAPPPYPVRFDRRVAGVGRCRIDALRTTHPARPPVHAGPGRP